MGVSDLTCWILMGFPRRGKITRLRPRTYTFEQGAEAPGRLEAVFGDLRRLSAADLGCGASETAVGAQILEIPWRRLVSVEVHEPYIKELRSRPCAAASHEIVPGRIEEVFQKFRPGEIDLGLMIDVLEHFTRADALGLLRRFESFFARGAVIFVPLGAVEQGALDGNELQRHRSFWRESDLARLGYDVEVCEAFHGHLDPPADAAWAIKRWA